MKPGDLVRVTSDCMGCNRAFRVGEIGVVIGPSKDRYLRNRGVFRTMFTDQIEDFSENLLEVLNEAG